MKIFTCSACRHMAFFENSQCTSCGHALGYLPDRGVLSALRVVAPLPGASAEAPLHYVAVDPTLASDARYRLCRNYTTYGVCNWAIPEDDANEYCPACRLNSIIPNLSDPSVLEPWRRLEVAKRRLVYTLIELDLPLESKHEKPETGLAFEFKVDGSDGEKVLTGHCDGLVTINVREADSPTLEQTRVKLGERYRTLLGHFRHESGHYYWDRLIQGTPYLSDFRHLFGDEQADYDEAVKRHYAAPRQNWETDFVSAYATMHPWEDWAETWAHYLHMIDTLETAQSYGLSLAPRAVGGAQADSLLARRVHFDDFDDLIAAWVPLTVALNSLNRSMGLPDVYPFVLAERVIAKLGLVHRVVAGSSPNLNASVSINPPGEQANPGGPPPAECRGTAVAQATFAQNPP